jgi:adenylate kinase family enzyme
VPKIIVLRGNSGSGKSTVARLLQERIQPHPLLIEHDHFRRKIIKEKEKDMIINPVLMLQTIQFGLVHGRDVIIEGILPAAKYTSFFDEVLELHPKENYFFYFDVPFEETLKRYATKPNAHEFGEADMKRWWKPLDLLPMIDEVVVKNDSSAEAAVERILRHIVAI